MSAKPQTKKFGKGTRDVPAASEKAQKWYPADDESQPKKVSFRNSRKTKKHPSRGGGVALAYEEARRKICGAGMVGLRESDIANRGFSVCNAGIGSRLHDARHIRSRSPKIPWERLICQRTRDVKPCCVWSVSNKSVYRTARRSAPGLLASPSSPVPS